MPQLTPHTRPFRAAEVATSTRNLVGSAAQAPGPSLGRVVRARSRRLSSRSSAKRLAGTASAGLAADGADGEQPASKGETDQHPTAHSGMPSAFIAAIESANDEGIAPVLRNSWKWDKQRHDQAFCRI